MNSSFSWQKNQTLSEFADAVDAVVANSNNKSCSSRDQKLVNRRKSKRSETIATSSRILWHLL